MPESPKPPSESVEAESGCDWPALLSGLLAGRDLSAAEAHAAMGEVVTGRVSPERLAAFMIALRAKGETVEEIIGFRDAALEHAVPLELTSWAVDVVGTGGDGLGTVNVSTMSAMVIAGAGIPVIKHGGRAVSARSGASDVLEALGARLTDDPARLREVFRRTGLAFVFAPHVHPGFAHAAPVRRELGVPTFFNLLGPLVNPARPEASAVGVADARAIPLVTGVFRKRGAAALVFRGEEGLDELSVSGYSQLWEVSNGAVTEHDIHPRDVGLGVHPLSELRGAGPEENARIAREVFAGERHGAVRDVVLFNAAAGMVAYELARRPESADRLLRTRFAEAIERAAGSIDSGEAIGLLDRWAAATRAGGAGDAPRTRFRSTA